jgi:hypothetical protein
MGAGTIIQDQKYSDEIPIQWQNKFLILSHELRPKRFIGSFVAHLRRCKEKMQIVVRV